MLILFGLMILCRRLNADIVQTFECLYCLDTTADTVQTSEFCYCPEFVHSRTYYTQCHFVRSELHILCRDPESSTSLCSLES